MAEPPWGPPQPSAPSAPSAAIEKRKAAPLPARREVTREDLEALVESKFTIKSRRGDGQMEALCPSHEDARPSLGIKIVPGDEGHKVIVDCRRGCDRKDVLAAVGLTFADLFTYDPKAKAKRGSGKGRVVATYAYTDEKGVPLFAVVRFEPKDFRQHALNPDGTTPDGPWSIKGIRRVLFRLPRVVEAVLNKRPVWVVEGEKDVLRLEALGLYATCNMGGASNGPNDKKWLPEYVEQLAGAAEVIVIPDNDEPGRLHAATVAASLAGRVGAVTLLDLAKFWPECPYKGDASDFLNAHPAEDGAVKLAAALAAAKTPAELVKAEPVDALPAPKRKANTEDEVLESEIIGRTPDDDDWKRDSSLTVPERLLWVVVKGVQRLKPGRQNVLTVLRQTPYFRGRIRYDEFSNRLLWTPPPGWLMSDGETTREWEECDTTEFIAWAERWLPGRPWDLAERDVEQSVLAVGKGARFHPLRDYLNGLVWDGKPRLHAWLVRHCNAELGRYSEAVGQAWLTSAVARVLEPGCQVDHMLVLRGGQGMRKTTLFRILAGGFYASMEGAELAKPADARQKLVGNWIVEFAELDSMYRNEIATVKAFLTETTDKFREPYARTWKPRPRTAVFAGTINKRDFLKDDTGNRRFWVIECGDEGKFDREKLIRERDQLWAEAVDRYRNWRAATDAGDSARAEQFQWWLREDDERLAREVQANHLEPGLYDETIREWLESDSRAPGSMLAEAERAPDGTLMLTTEKVLRFALGMEPRSWSDGNKKAAARGLVHAGWEFRQKRIGGGRPWRYVKVEQPVQRELDGNAGKDSDDDLPF